MSLQKLTNETYQLRENGEDFLYFGWLNKTKDSSACLAPNPIVSQPKYIAFFKIIANGSKVLPKFTCYVYEQKLNFLQKEKIDGKIVTTDLMTLK
jgi:hypothetical protein